jgi:hypothetical protein
MAAVVHVVTNKFPNVSRALPRIVDAVAKFYIDTVYDISQDLVPVDTGDLKDSGRVEKVGGGYRLVYDAKNRSGQSYAGYVEYGTTRTPAQPYLNPAADAALEMLGTNLDLEEMIAETL